MKDKAKTKAQLMAESAQLRQRVAKLEAAEAAGYVDIAEQRQSEDRLRQYMAQLEALRRIGLELTAELDLDTLLKSIVLRAVELLDATGGIIYLYRPETNVLELAVATGAPAGPPGLILRRDEGLSGRIWETGQPLVVDNYQSWTGRAAIYENYPLTTGMGVPIQLGQEFLGTLNVFNRPTPFSTADVELLSLFATQAAIAIHNAGLIESLQQSERSYKSLFAIERRQAQELYLLEQVRTALARELDLPTILRTIVEAIAQTFGYPQVSIYLLEGDVSVLQHQVGYDRVLARIPITQGVSGRVIHTGQPLLIKDVRADPDFFGAIDGLVSEICVPLLDQGQVVGFFNIESSQRVTLGEADLRLMVTLSEHVNWAISRARLYTEARESEQRYRIISDLTTDYTYAFHLESTQNFTLAWVTDAFTRITGYDPAEVPTYADWLNLVHPGDAAAISPRRELVLRFGQLDVSEFRIITKSGETRWLRDHLRPIWDKTQRRVVSLYGAGQDITKRKQTEEVLRESEDRYRSLFEDSPVSLWEEDFSAIKTYLDQLRAEGVEDFAPYFDQHPEVVHHCISLVRLIDVNQAALKLCGVSNKADLLSLSLKIIQEAFESFKKELLAIADGKMKFESEHITRSIIGSEIYVMVSWSVVPGYEESYGRVLVCVLDITERKKAEQALRASEQQQRELAQQNALLYAETQRRLKEQTALLEATSVISALPDLPTVLNKIVEQMGRIIDATSASIYNYIPETKTGTVLAEYSGPQACAAEKVSYFGVTYNLPHDLPEVFAFIQSDELSHTQHRDDPGLSEIEKRSMQQYNAWTSLTLRLQIGGQLIGFTSLRENRRRRKFTIEEVALCQGIAQYAAVAIENARLLEQARQDAKTKAVLLEEVNHRVKNNLATIIGLLYAERRHRVNPESQSTVEAIMQDLIYRVQGLATVHSMLSATEWSPLSLSELARQVIASTLQSLPPDKHVAVEVASSPVRVTPQQANNLALVINELTTNTVKYVLPEREIARISVWIDRDDDNIVFEFKNDGPDYPPQVLSLEFHNVGIYLIQNIVSMGLRGQMSLRNDSGAVTTIRFPAVVG